jgi:sulfite oxidase
MYVELLRMQIDVPVGDKGSKLEVICKAVDDSYNSQPETFGPIYNMRGVIANAWQRVNIEIA